MSFSQKALDAFYDGDVDKANELIQEALTNDDDDYLFNLGDTLLSMGQSVQAKMIFEQLLEKNPDADELRTRLAEISVSDGDSDKAIEYLSEVSPDSYAYSEALMASADLYQSLGLYEVSEQKLLEAIRMFPDEDVFRFALAELYFAQGNFQKALGFYEVLIENGITEYSGIQLYERLGDSLANIGEFEEAVEAYEKINQLVINEDILYKKGNLYYQIKDYDKSEKNLNELLDLNHDYVQAYVLLASDLYGQDKYEEAYRTAITGLKFDEFNADLYRLVLEAAIKINKVEEAVKITENGLDKVENPNDLIRMISDFYILDGSYEAAVNIINKYNTKVDDPYLAWNLAKAYRELDDVSAAKENIMFAYNELENNSDFLRDVVLILRDSGDLEIAKDALKKYLVLNPDDEYMRTLFDD